MMMNFLENKFEKSYFMQIQFEKSVL